MTLSFGGKLIQHCSGYGPEKNGRETVGEGDGGEENRRMGTGRGGVVNKAHQHWSQRSQESEGEVEDSSDGGLDGVGIEVDADGRCRAHPAFRSEISSCQEGE